LTIATGERIGYKFPTYKNQNPKEIIKKEISFIPYFLYGLKFFFLEDFTRTPAFDFSKSVCFEKMAGPNLAKPFSWFKINFFSGKNRARA